VRERDKGLRSTNSTEIVAQGMGKELSKEGIPSLQDDVKTRRRGKSR